MRWRDIEDNWWSLPGKPNGTWPGTKNKQSHLVWLSSLAQQVLANLDSNKDLVLPGRRGPITHADDAMRDICKDLGVNEKVTPHDLRRTHGTTITGLGFTREQMNRIQNHKEGGIGSVYDRHHYKDEARQIQEAVAERMIKLISRPG